METHLQKQKQKNPGKHPALFSIQIAELSQKHASWK